MKIADFGLARNVRDLEYYRKTTDVRWLVASERVFFFRHFRVECSYIDSLEEELGCWV